MEELPDFVKKARMTLSPNGSNFVPYEIFLKDYIKDNKMDFEEEAWNNDWNNGRDVIMYYNHIFEYNPQGNKIRRIFDDESAHIARAIDGSKKPKRPPPKRGSGSSRGKYPANNYGSQSSRQNENGYINGNRFNDYSTSSSSRYPFTSRTALAQNYQSSYYETQSSSQRYQNSSRTGSSQRSFGDQSCYNGYDDEVYSNNSTNLSVPPGFEPKIPPGFERKITPRALSPVYIKDDVSSQMENLNVSVDWYHNITYSKIIEDVAAKVFKMIIEMYTKGLKTRLTPDNLLSIIKEHKMESNFTLNTLKWFLLHCFSDSFHIVTEDNNSISIKSKSIQPKSEYHIIVKLPKRSIKKNRLTGTLRCEIINSEIVDNSSIEFKLRSHAWKDGYVKLTDELRRYSTLIEHLKPIDMIFKSDILLYFDSHVFYRCVVTSYAYGELVDIFLFDESDKRTVNHDCLYEMPHRFYKYNPMSFSLITDMGAENSRSGKFVKVSIERTLSDKPNQAIYRGKIMIDD